jgi:hypothetical protein
MAAAAAGIILDSGDAKMTAVSGPTLDSATRVGSASDVKMGSAGSAGTSGGKTDAGPIKGYDSLPYPSSDHPLLPVVRLEASNPPTGPDFRYCSFRVQFGR